MEEIKCDVLREAYQELKELGDACRGALVQQEQGLTSEKHRTVMSQFNQKKEHLHDLIAERKEYFVYLQDLYFTGRKWDERNETWIRDPEIQEIFDRCYTDYYTGESPLAFIFQCREDQISSTEEEAFSGDIVFHDDYIEIHNILELPRNTAMPKHIEGSLSLDHLMKWPEGVAMPKHIGGRLDLEALRELPKDIVVPEYIGSDLNLPMPPEWPQGVAMPKYVGGELILSGLTEWPERIAMPEYIGGGLSLRELAELPEDFALPERIEGDLDLPSITEWPKGVTMPRYVKGSLSLMSLTDLPDNFKFPEHIGETIYLNEELKGHPVVAGIPKGKIAWCEAW